MSTSANPPTTETNTQDKLEDPAASTATAPAVLEEDDEFEDFPVEGEYFYYTACPVYSPLPRATHRAGQCDITACLTTR